VGELNTTIRDIRSTIFELKHSETGALKSEVRALVREYVPVLGFTPFVRLRGALDGGVPADTAEHLLATLREALSNVAKHADADACVVEAEVVRDWLTLRVSDNGRGVGGTGGESGLRNVRRRALELGGRFNLVPEDPHGTLLEWQVPLRG
jgi:signal transduction histidine kinase